MKINKLASVAVILMVLGTVGLVDTVSGQNKSSKSNWDVYYSNCKKCTDPWVGELFTNLWGLCPSQVGGQSDFCNINLYNNGSWNNKEQLEGFVRGRFAKSGTATVNVYVFIKPENVKGLGHIGWAFGLSDGTFFGGSTENYGAGYWVSAGDDNDFWSQKFESEADMFAKFRALNYSKYKAISWPKANVLKGKLRAEEVMWKGFQGISNNCLDHTYQILEALGIPQAPIGNPNAGLPWRANNPTPNGWFNDFFWGITGKGKAL